MNRKILIGGIGAVALLVAGGAVWAGFLIADQLGAPGVSPPTGSGPCTSADAVTVHLAFADGRSVQACTHDQPACQSRSIAPRFALSNQLRSSSRRYILFVAWDVTLAAGDQARVLQLNGGAFLPKGPPSPAGQAGDYAIVELTPRDPTEGSWSAGSGTLTLAPISGGVRGDVDGAFAGRTSAPTAITGSFSCRL